MSGREGMGKFEFDILLFGIDLIKHIINKDGGWVGLGLAHS